MSSASVFKNYVHLVEHKSIIVITKDIKEGKYKDGLVNGILEAGEQLKKHFPYNHEEDTNELSNEISRG